MTTVAQIVTDAYQFNNLIALGAIPSAGEQAKGLRYLNRLFKSVFGNEIGDKLETVNIGSTGVTYDSLNVSEDVLFAPYFLPSNYRFVLNISAPITAYLPTNPEDGAQFALQDTRNNLATYPVTVNGNGRTIQSATTLVVNTNSFNGQWFYRADKGDWTRVSDLALLDVFPLPEEFEEFFITMLSIRLNSSENISSSPEISLIMKEAVKKFKARYRQTTQVSVEEGLLRTPLHPYKQVLRNTTRFNYG